VPRLEITQRINSLIVNIQAKFKRKMQQAIYKKISSNYVLKCKYLQSYKIFISCVLYQEDFVKVYI
jgi:hypothetical protein